MCGWSFSQRQILLLGLGISALVWPAGAQAASNTATATAGASATVAKPITLAKDADLQFGSFTSDGVSAGTVTISAAGVRGSTGGVVLVTGAAPTAAQFTLNGATGQAFSVTVPSTTVLSFGVNTITATLQNNAPTALTGSSQVFRVFGSLPVAATQAAGAYTNASAISVTASYN